MAELVSVAIERMLKMKRVLVNVLVLVVLLSLSGCGDDESVSQKTSPIKVNVEKYYNKLLYSSYPIIHITSVEDDLEIKDVIVNKGHCKLLRGNLISSLFPKKLQYSGKVRIPLNIGCDVIKIDVKTNLGDWSVEY